jgi:hypothetical protein
MTRETLPIIKLYKTLIFIGIVVGPIYWLMFTDDGKRRTDTMVLWLAGGTSIDLNFKVLDDHYQPDDWKHVYPRVEWHCKDTRSSLGSHLCHAEIASYNGIPSKYLSVFFDQERTSAVKLVYRDQYHNEIGRDLIEQLGKPDVSGVADGNSRSDANILQWQTQNGLVLLKKTLERGEEATLMWIPIGSNHSG